MTIEWQTKRFDELSNDELYDLLKLRIDVFVVEQTCYYPDLDDLDRADGVLHLLGKINNEIVAYLRILPQGVHYEDYVAIGRVLTREDVRSKGYGHPLMAEAISQCKQRYPAIDIKISAQQHLEKFYEKHGFVTVSDMYLEDDIPHIAMLRAVNSN